MRFVCALVISTVSALPIFAQVDTPKTSDPRLVVELVAAAPDIVHPISCDFDQKGRLLVIESHTHFAPKGYTGPKFDRIRAFDVKTGKATTFFEGTRHTMDLAVHPDGSVYIATRNEIMRLRESKDGSVKSERIVFLDTKGDYPHNGLSGLCFDAKGDLIFGMGENLGMPYVLRGSDKTEIKGDNGGEVLHCTADGKNLRSIARGFWNPFGNCRDIFGRLFCVDNDPDQAPPCRMLHVVEGGDYGFRFSYGRSGKHPFQSWHGELPGTLPMMTGVGEAPCEILSYESDGLPKEYLGQLLVTSWADHRVERYKVVPHGASFKAERLPFVQGGNNFRPTGMCVAPDGSLYVADWVKSDYTLHGKGAIWRIRDKDSASRERKRPEDPREAILSLHRPLREAAAIKLAADEKQWSFLKDFIERKGDPRVRAAAAEAMLHSRENVVTWDGVAHDDSDAGLREIALRALLHRNRKTTDYTLIDYPAAIRAIALQGLANRKWESFEIRPLIDLLSHEDAFLRHAALHQLGHSYLALGIVGETPREQIGLLLAQRQFLTAKRGQKGYAEEPIERASAYLKDKNDEIRYLAAKWIADEKLSACRPGVEKLLVDPKLSVRTYTALATALARLDGKDVNEKSLADYFAKRLADDATPPALRTQLIKQVPATHKTLTVELLTKFLKSDDAALKLEAVRALVEHPSTKRHKPLLDVFENTQLGTHMRAFALLGVLDRPFEQHVPMVLPYATDPKSPLHADAERALLGAIKKPGEVYERLPFKDRPAAKDIDAWLKRLEGNADADAGARVFFHPKVGTCSKCHRIDGRGADVGPDLSGIGRTDRRHILESILLPSNTVAPHYQGWHIETSNGKTRTGMLLHTQLDEYTYLDPQGNRFMVKTNDVVELRSVANSIMPDGLVDRLTDQEIRDLLAYLQARK